MSCWFSSVEFLRLLALRAVAGAADRANAGYDAQVTRTLDPVERIGALEEAGEDRRHERARSGVGDRQLLQVHLHVVGDRTGVRQAEGRLDVAVLALDDDPGRGFDASADREGRLEASGVADEHVDVARQELLAEVAAEDRRLRLLVRDQAFDPSETGVLRALRDLHLGLVENQHVGTWANTTAALTDALARVTRQRHRRGGRVVRIGDAASGVAERAVRVVAVERTRIVGRARAGLTGVTLGETDAAQGAGRKDGVGIARDVGDARACLVRIADHTGEGRVAGAGVADRAGAGERVRRAAVFGRARANLVGVTHEARAVRIARTRVADRAGRLDRVGGTWNVGRAGADLVRITEEARAVRIAVALVADGAGRRERIRRAGLEGVAGADFVGVTGETRAVRIARTGVADGAGRLDRIRRAGGRPPHRGTARCCHIRCSRRR